MLTDPVGRSNSLAASAADTPMSSPPYDTHTSLHDGTRVHVNDRGTWGIGKAYPVLNNPDRTGPATISVSYTHLTLPTIYSV